MSCDPERVTGYLDGELAPTLAAAVAAHLEGCALCRRQLEEERVLRERLRGLPAPRQPDDLEPRVRAALAARPPAVPAALRWALPLAAALLLGVWLRGYAPLVAWDLARDHDKCFSHHPPPAKVVSSEPGVVSAWFGERGTRMPALPGRVGDLELVGARYCPLVTLSEAPHVYYASARGQVSLFVVPHGVRVADHFASRPRGDSVRLLRLEGVLVGIVGAQEAEVRRFESALRPAVADARITPSP